MENELKKQNIFQNKHSTMIYKGQQMVNPTPGAINVNTDMIHDGFRFAESYIFHIFVDRHQVF